MIKSSPIWTTEKLATLAYGFLFVRVVGQEAPKRLAALHTWATRHTIGLEASNSQSGAVILIAFSLDIWNWGALKLSSGLLLRPRAGNPRSWMIEPNLDTRAR